MIKAGVPVVPGTEDAVENVDEALKYYQEAIDLGERPVFRATIIPAVTGKRAEVRRELLVPTNAETNFGSIIACRFSIGWLAAYRGGLGGEFETPHQRLIPVNKRTHSAVEIAPGIAIIILEDLPMGFG